MLFRYIRWYTLIRSLEKNPNVLRDCFAREFQEKHLMLFHYVRWSPRLSITTFLKYTRDDLEIDEVVIEGKEINTVNYIECVDNKSRKTTRACDRITLPTLNSIWRLNIQICDDVDRWLGFQFFPYVDRWFLEKNLRRISRNTSHAFPFRRWSAPLTDHSFFEIQEEWPGIRSFNGS